MSTPPRKKNNSKKKVFSPLSDASPKKTTSAAQAEITNADGAVVEAIDNQSCSRAKSSPCKAKGQGSDASIIAYVHCLSRPRRNKKDTLDYSTLILQTESKPTQEALLYSKNKQPLLLG